MKFLRTTGAHGDSIRAPLSQIKSRYPHVGANPNQIMQSLAALLAVLHVPFLCTETHELGE